MRGRSLRPDFVITSWDNSRKSHGCNEEMKDAKQTHLHQSWFVYIKIYQHMDGSTFGLIICSQLNNFKTQLTFLQYDIFKTH